MFVYSIEDYYIQYNVIVIQLLFQYFNDNNYLITVSVCVVSIGNCGNVCSLIKYLKKPFLTLVHKQ